MRSRINIIRSSTLFLEGITKVPISFFQHITVTTLKLHDIPPVDFCDESSLTPASSKGVAPVASHTVIDQCFWRFELYRYEITFIRLFFTSSRQRRANMITKSIFLPFMCRIRILKIDICLHPPPGDNFYLSYFVIRSLFINLTSPATIEQLEFNAEFSRIVIEYDSFYDNLRDADLGRHLDSIATHPTDLRVDINIIYAYDVDEFDVDRVKEVVFDISHEWYSAGAAFK